jgi:hypothetical protein
MVLACPNINLKEWKDLVQVVTEVEAYRDYIETNGQIRDYNIVFEKLNKRREKPSLGSAFLIQRLKVASEKVQYAAKIAALKQVRSLEREVIEAGKDRKNVLSNARYGKISNDEFTFISIPKLMDEKTIASGSGFTNLRKDQASLKVIEDFIANQTAKGIDMSFIQIVPNENSTMVRVPTKMYYESRKELETPEQFISYYKGDSPEAVNVDPNSLLGNAITEGGAPGVDIDANTNAKSVGILTSFARALSNQLLIDGKAMNYSFITEAEAVKILGEEEYARATSNSKFSIKGFFHGDTVYFVGDNLTLDIVFHEFAHPVIRSIMRTNPELGTNLYNKLISTEEGRALIEEVKRKYPELNENSEQFKEEALVWALTKAADLQSTNTRATPAFIKMIKDFIAFIRQHLRKKFKQDFSKLGINTSIEELAEMLKQGKAFELSEEAVSEADAVAYIKEMKQEIDEMLKVSQTNRNAISMRQYDIAVKHINEVMTNQNYKEVIHLLLDEYERGDLDEIRRNLSKFSRPMQDRLSDMRDQIEYNKAHAEAMVNSLFRLQNIVKKIETHLKTLKEDPDNKDNMQKAFYYDHFLDYWGKFADEVAQAIGETEGVDSDSALSKLVGSVKTSVENSTRTIKGFYQNGVKDVIFETLEPAAMRIAQKHADIIAHLKLTKAPQKLIDKAMEEFYGLTESEMNDRDALQAKVNAGRANFEDKLRLEALMVKSFNGAQITPEKIEMALKGKMKDANVFNSFFEGYMYNTDPIVGGFALFVKNHMADVAAITQRKANGYITDMKPLLEAAGYNPANVNQLIERICRKEVIGRFNSKGEWEEKEIWVLKSAHKDWRIAIDRFSKEINAAEKEHLMTGTKEAYLKYQEAVERRDEHMRQYFYQKYDPKVYSAQALLEKDEIGRKAATALNKIMDLINSVTRPLTTQIDELEALDRLDSLWKERARLFSLVDEKGKVKDPDSDEYKIAVRLREYRALNKDPETNKSYHEWKLRKGLFENSFEQYQQELANLGLNYKDKEFKEKEKEWLAKNTRVVINDLYYDDYKKIMNSINEILAKLPASNKKVELLAEAWSKIFDMASDKRDDDGQPDGGLFTAEQLKEIQNLQDKIKRLEEEVEGYKGLTKPEQVRMSRYRAMFNDKIKLNDEEKKDYNTLSAKAQSLGLPKSEQVRLQGLFKKLRELRSKEATPYYIDIVNAWLSEMSPDVVKLYFSKGVADEITIDRILEPSVQEALFKESSDFKNWFNDNHTQEQVFDYNTSEEVTRWERTHPWVVAKPLKDEHYESVSVKYADGTEETLLRAPKLKYYIRKVKDEYRTERVVGKTVDNQGNFLPRIDIPNSPYIDNEYLNMKNTDPAHYEVLEKMKEHHLANQEGVPRKSKLYLDVPRFRKNNLELIRTRSPKELTKMASQGKLPLLHALLERARNFFKGSKDEAGIEQNWKDDTMLLRLDMYDNEIAPIPVFGLSDIGIDDVSPDLNESILRYMGSLEKQKKLIELNPVAQALKSTLNDPNNMVSEDLNKINKFNFLHRGIITYKKKKGLYVRKWAVNNFIEREFEGKVDAGFTKDIYPLQNFGNLIFKRASFSFFALNIPSAMKNALGAKFQSMVEASAGQYTNHSSMAKGEIWSGKTMAEISLSLYKHDVKPLNIQIAYAFDAIRDMAETKTPETLSRTFARDLASFSWLYNFRKWTQGQAELQLFGGMMYKQTVMQNGKEINYMDAWEVRDKILALKEGIDVRYSNSPTTFMVQPEDTVESLAKFYNVPMEDADKLFKGKVKPGREITIDNNKFKDFRNTLHTVQMNLAGAYDRFSQPEAQRYLAFRFISFMKRYFTTMLMNRWAFSGGLWHAKGRFVPGLGDTQEGYYVTVIKTLHRTFTTGSIYFPYMTPTEKKAWIKFLVEIGSTMALLMIVAPLLGWDPEDPERYEKLRQRSGSMPFLGADEDPEHPFDAGGFMMNHLLKLTLDVRAENETFIPFPNYGLDNYTDTATDISSIGFGPTIKTYKKMLEYLYMEATGNPYARYQKEAGAYNWQEEGGSKLASEFAKALGMTGSSIDPITTVKNTYGSKHE